MPGRRGALCAPPAPEDSNRRDAEDTENAPFRGLRAIYRGRHCPAYAVISAGIAGNQTPGAERATRRPAPISPATPRPELVRAGHPYADVCAAKVPRRHAGGATVRGRLCGSVLPAMPVAVRAASPPTRAPRTPARVRLLGNPRACTKSWTPRAHAHLRYSAARTYRRGWTDQAPPKNRLP